MKKLIILTLALAGTASTSLVLQAIKTKDKQNYAHAAVRYQELSAALKTNEILQGAVARDIKEGIKNKKDASTVQENRARLESLRNNEEILNQETETLLDTHPKLKEGGGS